MHYYQFHISDYAAATAHLTPIEDLAYRRLIDLYYDTEKEITHGLSWVSKRIRIDVETVENVIKEFFIRTETGWKNERCDIEIAKYHAYLSKQRINGSMGGRPVGTGKQSKNNPRVNLGFLTDNPTVTQNNPNHEPLTTNQKEHKPPIPPNGGGAKFAEFWTSYPKKVGKGAAEKAWSKARINGHAHAVMDALDAQKCSSAWSKDNGQFIPNPATWINQRRWEDDLTTVGGLSEPDYSGVH
jgi:uncharacterized protein YdaU (DUF1376 family)